jgi:hypothetical protein
VKATPPLSWRLAACAAALLLIAGCQNVPKYKKSSGKFNEWKSYEGDYVKPIEGIVTAVDPAAHTITIQHGDATKVFPVTADTRLMHQGDDITLAQLPINQGIRYTLSEDGSHLLTVWYGRRTVTLPGAASSSPKP